jgi:hypothetical protein
MHGIENLLWLSPLLRVEAGCSRRVLMHPSYLTEWVVGQVGFLVVGQFPIIPFDQDLANRSDFHFGVLSLNFQLLPRAPSEGGAQVVRAATQI